MICFRFIQKFLSNFNLDVVVVGDSEKGGGGGGKKMAQNEDQG